MVFLPIIELLQQRFGDRYEKAGGVGFRYYHSLQVAKITKLLAEDLKLNPHNTTIVLAAAYLHDISKHQGSSSVDNHQEIGAVEAREILASQLSAEDAAQVAETILRHDRPITLLQQVLHDADELAGMGLINIWKMFTYSCQAERDLKGTIEYWQKIDRASHLAKRKTLCLTSAKKIADTYIAQTDTVISELAATIQLAD